ncbi:MAG: hypothetical protein Q8Q35_00970 [Nanoarchaeota archaeon]|nr:hypothetical protein [Nanoarchaeota archaeon]
MKDLEQLAKDMGRDFNRSRFSSIGILGDSSIVVNDCKDNPILVSNVIKDLRTVVRDLRLAELEVKGINYGFTLWSQKTNEHYFLFRDIGPRSVKVSANDVNMGDYTASEVLQAYAKNLNNYNFRMI